jgi:hypothetical protein
MLSGFISNLESLVDELSSFPASDLDPDAGALVHLYVWLLLGFLQRSHLRFYGLHQDFQLVCHHQYPFRERESERERERERDWGFLTMLAACLYIVWFWSAALSLSAISIALHSLWFWFVRLCCCCCCCCESGCKPRFLCIG